LKNKTFYKSVINSVNNHPQHSTTHKFILKTFQGEGKNSKTFKTHFSLSQSSWLPDLRDMITWFTIQSSTVGSLVSNPSGSHGLRPILAQPLNSFLAYRYSGGYRLPLSWPTINKDGYR